MKALHAPHIPIPGLLEPGLDERVLITPPCTKRRALDARVGADADGAPGRGVDALLHCRLPPARPAPVAVLAHVDARGTFVESGGVGGGGGVAVAGVQAGGVAVLIRGEGGEGGGRGDEEERGEGEGGFG